MVIDDVVRAGKVAKTAKAASTAAKAADVVVEFRGVRYAFPPGTSKEAAERVLWNKVVKAQAQKSEEIIELPSELPKERIEEIAKQEVPPQTAEILEFKPKKLDPGIYLDEDTGKYFKIDKDGSMTELEADEAP